jgi:hypothetical protein
MSRLLRIQQQRRRVVTEKFMTRHALHTRKFTIAALRRAKRASSETSTTGVKS